MIRTFDIDTNLASSSGVATLHHELGNYAMKHGVVVIALQHAPRMSERAAAVIGTLLSAEAAASRYEASASRRAFLPQGTAARNCDRPKGLPWAKARCQSHPWSLSTPPAKTKRGSEPLALSCRYVNTISPNMYPTPPLGLSRTCSLARRFPAQGAFTLPFVGGRF